MWFKIDDKLHDHPKVQRLLERYGDDGLAAMGLWTLAGSWCGDQMSDGLISGFVLRRWHSDWESLAFMLVDSGMWNVTDVDGRPHHEFHDWTDYNDTREKILADRIAEKMRVALIRDVELVTAIKARDRDRCRYCGCQVRWGNQRGPMGATYDHIVPIKHGGTNTIGNVVIACRGCNSRKRHLTLEEAGMKLLRPGSMGAPAVYEVPSSSRSTRGSGRDGLGSGPQDTGSGPQNVLSTTEDTPSTTDHETGVA